MDVTIIGRLLPEFKGCFTEAGSLARIDSGLEDTILQSLLEFRRQILLAKLYKEHFLKIEILGALCAREVLPLRIRSL